MPLTSIKEKVRGLYGLIKLRLRVLILFALVYTLKVIEANMRKKN